MNRAQLAKDLAELKIQGTLSSNGWLLLCDDDFLPLFGEWGIDPARVVSIDRIGSIESPPGVNFAVVCTERPEGPVQQALKKRGIQSAGLYSQIIPRLAAGVPPRFHPSPDQKLNLEYAIVCLPRCGSTLVSRELQLLGAGNPVEHFRGFIQTLLKERETSGFDLTRWWALVRAGRSVGPVFGTKIIFDFWKMADRYMSEDERRHMLDFLGRVPIIYIERADKCGQAVSDTVARSTGVWHIWNENIKGTYEDKLQRVGSDLSEAIVSYRKFRRSERELSEFLTANARSVVKIEYDDLLRAPKDVIADVADRMGLTIPEGYRESRLTLEPTTSETHLRLRERLREEVE